MNAKVANTATVVIAACAVAVTAMVARREFFARPVAETNLVREIAGWRELANGGHVIGMKDAPIKIIEFADFQCPYCRQTHFQFRLMAEQYPGQVAVVYRHFPLSSHPFAFAAAVASECAAAQGRFTAFHDALYEHQDSLGIKPWTDFARAVNVPDVPEFRQCFAERRFEQRVRRDRALGDSIGVRGTPTVIVNGLLLSGMVSVAKWEELIDEALAGE